MKEIHIFSDFDGTITNKDTLVFLAGTLGGGTGMVQAIGRLIRENRITLREGIAAEMRSIRAPFSRAEALLREEVRIDDGFHSLARWCEEEGVPLTVLSAGFHQIIDLFIRPEDFPRVEVLANTLDPDTDLGWQCVFRDRTEFGHDKAKALQAASRAGKHTIFIGDGLSDRGAAEVADEVFAKHSLVQFCRDKGIPYREFDTFHDILRNLTSIKVSAASAINLIPGNEHP
ncbi:MAG: HAD-IB family phosphatase [Acidobacteriota bacterium]|nr:MAG: HAD-IB family phosphatase [Acidobacteriota bacterium]